MDKNKVLEDYISFRALKNKTSAIDDIRNHAKWFINSSKKDLKDFEEKDLVNYITKISPKYSGEMLNKIKGSIIKNFIKWHFVDWSKRFRNLDSICRTEKTESKYKPEDMISEEDFKKLIHNEASPFWKAYFMVLFYSSSRPVEVCRLKWSDVEFEQEGGAYITIFSNKNKKSFIKYVPADVVFYLNGLKNDHKEWVFYNPITKEPITKKGAYFRIVRLSQKVLNKKLDLYTLRHSIATINYNKDGIKDDDIARQMGHSKSMKAKYQHNDKNKLKEQARKIYLSPDMIAPEKKHKLELEIEDLKKNQDLILSLIKNVNSESKEGMEALDLKFIQESIQSIKK